MSSSTTGLVETGTTPVKQTGCSLLAKIIIGVTVSAVVVAGAASAGYFLTVDTNSNNVKGTSQQNSSTTSPVSGQTTTVADETDQPASGQTSAQASDDTTTKVSNGQTTVAGLPGQTTAANVPGQTTGANVPGQTTVAGVPGQTTAAGVPGQTTGANVPGQTTVANVLGQTTGANVPGQTTVARETTASGVNGQTTGAGVSGQTTMAVIPGQTTGAELPGQTTGDALPGQTTRAGVQSQNTDAAVPGQTTIAGVSGQTTRVSVLGQTTDAAVPGQQTTIARVPGQTTGAGLPGQITENGVLGQTTVEPDDGFTEPSVTSENFGASTAGPLTTMPTTTAGPVCPTGYLRTVIFSEYNGGSDKLWLRGANIPLTHLQSSDTNYNSYAQGDTKLDWEGKETGQVDGALGTPTLKTTNDFTSSSYHPLNTFGPNHWMTDACLDCSGTENNRFQFKMFDYNWESLNGGDNNCINGNNHYAQCGKINVFHFGSTNNCQINDFPGEEQGSSPVSIPH